MEITQEYKKFVATETLTISTEKATHVKCLVRHPAWHSNPLVDFVIIRRNRKIKSPRTTTSLPETTPALKTTREIITDQFSTIEKESSEFSTTADFSTRGKTKRPRTTTETTREITTDRFSTGRFSTTEKEDSEFSTTANFSTRGAKYSATTSLPFNTSQSNSSDGSTVVLPDATTQNQTSRSWNTTDLTTTQTDISFNETKRNSTDNNVEKQTINEGSASALIFLVTCLIIGLVVVLIFIFIKLRRAHIAWKRENDDSNQTSETSGKSKSSQEDKNGKKRRGFFNTGITHYVVQEPAVITSVTNPHAMTAPEDRATTEEIAPVPPLHRPQKNQKSRKQSCKIYCCPQTICCLLLECK
uniref:Uncharacterized protein n=1 Tax=Neogobius melanostomus TaxID=47308 RepID=A0A8C6S364_9GOBI